MKKPIDELLKELLDKKEGEAGTVTITFDSEQKPIKADEYILIYKSPTDENRIHIHNHSSMSFIESLIENEIIEQHAIRHQLHALANNMINLFK